MKIADVSPISDIALVRIRGRDAEAFAQSQFMNDVLALPEGRWHWNGWLTAKGRVRALFALARVAPGELLLVLLDRDPGTFAEALGRFLFRSKATIHVEEQLSAFGEWRVPDGHVGPRDVLLRDGDRIGFDLSASDTGRILWAASGTDGTADPVATARWRDADLRHGLPRCRSGHELDWTPHMLSLDRLNAFSVKKGCYPGQEIVARTHFLGHSKRQAWWLEGHGLAPGLPVFDGEGRPLGDIVNVTADGTGALAILALAAPSSVKSGDAAAWARPPAVGLARPG